MICKYYLILLVFINLFSSGIGKQIITFFPNVNDEIGPIEIKNQSVNNIIYKLQDEYHIQIGFEEIEYDESMATDTIEFMYKNEKHYSYPVKKKKIDLVINKKSVREILDELVEQDNDYFWEISEEGVINVLPRSNNPNNKYEKCVLNKIILPSVDINTIVNYAMPRDVAQVFLEHNILIKSISIGDVREYKNTPVKVKLEHPTLRKYLNTFIKSAGPNFGWYFMGVKGRRMFDFSWYPIQEPNSDLLKKFKKYQMEHKKESNNTNK